MSDFHFLGGKGHLPARADKIARKHGASLTNFVDPGTKEKRHWFSCRNRGFPFDDQTAREVRQALEDAGVL